jgi:ribonuclease Y
MFNLFKKIKPQSAPTASTTRAEKPLVNPEELARAKQEAKEVIVRANEDATRIREEAAREASRIKQEALEAERKLQSRESQLANNERRSQQALEASEAAKADIETARETMLAKLEKVSGMTKEQAKETLLTGWEDKMQGDISRRIRQAEEEMKLSLEEKTKELLVDAMKHGATDYVAEYTMSTIPIPSDDVKGRIIGKDGRNIRAFELATAVDVDLEEEGVIKLSSFDAVKREVARISLERLIRDGRVQPARIEEIVHTVKKEVDKIMFRAGEELCHKVGVYNLPNDITQALGKFKFRFSYGQNMILHTLEETKIGIALAHELKADVNVVKLGCLLHDIGKVIDSVDGGNHVTLGVEYLKKNRFPQSVVHCVEAHHEDIPFESVEAMIVYIADAISGSRPGARHEDFEDYLKRIKTIEDAAKTKKGVRDAYALQAGRELRVVVRPEEITDDEMVILAQKIREELESKFEVFPGQIKVTVIRESRAEAVTKI